MSFVQLIFCLSYIIYICSAYAGPTGLFKALLLWLALRWARSGPVKLCEDAEDLRRVAKITRSLTRKFAMLEAKIDRLRRYGLGIFLAGFVCVSVALFTPAWMVCQSDHHLTTTTTEVGLLYLCNTSYKRTGDRAKLHSVCRVDWEHFEQGLIMEFVQYFFTVCFIGCVGASVLIVMVIWRVGPWKNHITKLVRMISAILSISAACGIMAAIGFSSSNSMSHLLRDKYAHHVGYSFALAILGSCLLFIAGLVFLIETNMRSESERRRPVNELQTQVQLIPRP